MEADLYGSGCEFAFASFGLRIGIWLEDPAWLPGIIHCLPPGWTPAESNDLDRVYQLRSTATGETMALALAAGVALTMDDELAAWAPTPELILDALESQLQLYVAEFARPALFVHAGVVHWRGATIMLPGSSFAGKSTLVTALVQAGATYFSDEYAVLNHDGQVLPYVRRLSLRDGPLGRAGRLDLSSHAPQGNAASQPVPVDIVLFTRFEAGSEWSCDELAFGPAMLALCEHTVAIQRRPSDAFAILGKVAEGAGVYKGVRGDLEPAMQWLDGLVDWVSANQQAEPCATDGLLNEGSKCP